MPYPKVRINQKTSSSSPAHKHLVHIKARIKSLSPSIKIRQSIQGLRNTHIKQNASTLNSPTVSKEKRSFFSSAFLDLNEIKISKISIPMPAKIKSEFSFIEGLIGSNIFSGRSTPSLAIHQSSAYLLAESTPKKRSFSTTTTVSSASQSASSTVVAEHAKEESIAEMVAKLTPIEKSVLNIFRTGAMSHGSISLEAHKEIARAMNELAIALHGFKNIAELLQAPGHLGPLSNAGEGGEQALRDGTIYQSRICQVASGRFGVTTRLVGNRNVIEIKINQGAKPGVGGELHGHKVNEQIAEVRHTEPGVTLVSPPPHHDIYSIEDLKQLIHDLRSANPDALISVKLAACDGIGVIAAGVAKCGADIINIAGPGGTGAAKRTAKYEFVHPWEKALAEVHQTLVAQGLRERVKLTVSGGLNTSLDAFYAILLGADYLEMGTQALIALGCIMAEKCHDGTCPAGIATTNQTLIDDKFEGKAEHVARLFIQNAKIIARYLEQYGFTKPEEARGRTDLLRVKDNVPVEGLERLLFQPLNPYSVSLLPLKETKRANGSSSTELDFIEKFKISGGGKTYELQASNCDLTFGARLGRLSIQEGMSRLFDQPTTIRFNGLAVGQSFGFLAPKNITLVAEHTNDGTGKSLDGGKIIAKTMGNQTGYGAIKGKIFTRFLGNRGAVRLAGSEIVTEWAGPFAANFMTGGTFIILGSPSHYPNSPKIKNYRPPVLLRSDAVGPNFGASFSGGHIYLPKKLFDDLKKRGYLAASTKKLIPKQLDLADEQKVRTLLEEYALSLESPIAQMLLSREGLIKQMFYKLDPKHSNENKKEASKEQGQATLKTGLTSSQSTSMALSQLLTINPDAKPTKVIPEGLTHPEREKDACGTAVLVKRDGIPSHEVVERGILMLARMMHRGSVGVDEDTGDGCGIFFIGLDEFFQNEFPQLNLQKNDFAVIPMSLSYDTQEQSRAVQFLSTILAKEHLSIAGGREVKTRKDLLGPIGQSKEQVVRQFIVIKPDNMARQEFEERLIKSRLRFECQVQRQGFSIRPHIYSASARGVLYKSLVKEDKLGSYFRDFKSDKFKATACIDHARFATNTLPTVKNIQPLPNTLANNGENNNIEMVNRFLCDDPTLRTLLKIEHIDLVGCSDSHLMSIYIDVLRLLGYAPEKIILSTINPYSPTDNHASDYFNLFAIPFEGPNASIVFFEDLSRNKPEDQLSGKIFVTDDKNGFRPLRGIANKEFFFFGSELGPVEIEGEVLDLPPGKPLVFDLATGTYKMYEPDSEHLEFCNTQLKSLKRLKAGTEPDPILFEPERLQTYKLLSGWSEEIDQTIMQPLFNGGKGALTSMGDQGPFEPHVKGSAFDLGSHFKGKFLQVTAPTSAPREEAAYMSTLTFVGRKPALKHLGEQKAEGYLLTSPIVDNREMQQLVMDSSLSPKVIKITYPVYEYEKGIKGAIERIKQECLQAIKDGHILIILSDLERDLTIEAVIPPVLIASILDKMLLASGIRRQVSIAVQSSYILSGRDVAQAITIGGADIVNPYLPCVPTVEEQQSGKHRQRITTYKESLREELLAFMARMGLSSVTAYRGITGFSGYGISADLANDYRIQSDFGGLNYEKLAIILKNQFEQPAKKGLGRYLYAGQEARKKIWDPSIVRPAIRAARSVKESDVAYQEMETKANALKHGVPRGLLRLIEPPRWSPAHPMRVCVIGGGAAGFNVVTELLHSGLPVELTIVEARLVNLVGLVGYGVAPDHEATKKQIELLKEIVSDPRVRYVGGVRIGEDVTIKDLQQHFSVLIDCSGAHVNNKLNIPGEESPLVIPASQVYLSYNDEFKLHPSDWPLNPDSTDNTLCIIGNGNVANDIARIFMHNPDHLEETTINPEFLRHLRQEGPTKIKVIARGNPCDSKMSLKELEELGALGFWMSSSFDDATLDLSTSTEQQQQLYKFFAKIRNRKPPRDDSKQLYFIFGCTPIRFIESKEKKNITTVFKTKAGEEISFTARNVVTAIGMKPMKSDERITYSAGWVVGKGGTLISAQQSAINTVSQIKTDFHKGMFNRHQPSPHSPLWQFRAVNNEQFLNIITWVRKKRGKIRTIDDFNKARNAGLSTMDSAVVAPTFPTRETLLTVSIDPEAVAAAISAPGSKEVQRIPIHQANATLLQFFKSSQEVKQHKAVPKDECGGDKICGTCAFEIDAPLVQTKKVKDLLKINQFDPNKSALSCNHQIGELKGKTIRLVK